MKIFSLVLCLLIAIAAHAEDSIKITGVGGASKVDLSTSPVQIYAGIAGDVSSCGGAPCNTCNTGDLKPCNFNAVGLDTYVSITLTATKSGRIQLYDGSSMVYDFSTAAGTYTAGSTKTVQIKWNDLKGLITGFLQGQARSKNFTFGISENGTSLAVSTGITFKISNFSVTIDNWDSNHPYDPSYANPTGGGEPAGVEDFYLFPGDSKAYLVHEPLVFNSATFNVVAIDAFYAPSPGTCDATTVNNSSAFTRIAIDPSTHELTDNRIEDLENDVTYTVRLAIEDDTGNIGFFTAGAAEPGTPGACTVGQHNVTPQEVYGLLEKNMNCFISTAAFGSPLNSKVQTFHKFRDHILKKYSLGRDFINFYYKVSPPIAHKIAKSEILKSLTRIFLWPLWGISFLILKIGVLGFLFFIFGLFFVGYLLKKKLFKKSAIVALTILFFLPIKSFSQESDDAFFNLDSSEQSTEQEIPPPEVIPQETPPQEPPYTGVENEEPSPQENQSADIKEQYAPGPGTENPNKWKPFHRVPDEQRLKELSNEGLFKITKKGEYLYNIKPTPQNHASSLRFGVAQFPNLSNPTSGVTFQQIYGEDKKPMLMVDYEWQFFQSAGKLGLKLETGLFVASGHGQFVHPVTTVDGTTTDAEEKYTLFMFPNSLGLVYRLDILPRQWLVPYASVGIDYYTFMELRDDGFQPKFGGAPAFHFSAGGSFLLDVLGRQAMAMVDQRYGVNHIWLTAEFRHIEGLGNSFDFTDDVVNGGFMFEF